MTESVQLAVGPTGSRSRFPIVAIGASAGGLEPIEALLHTIPVDCGLAFVVVQHLSPDFVSHMSSILGRATDMPVLLAEQGMTVEVNCVYLIPANKTMTIKSEKLQLTPCGMERRHKLPIDAFMVSLAADVGDRAIGVVLSGTGSDGTTGVQAISDAGGWVLVQDEKTAQFDGMPGNAIASGAADVIGSPGTLADSLCSLERSSSDLTAESERMIRTQTSTHTQELNRIIELLRQFCSIDFSQYKHSTVGRRIRRRMRLLKIDQLLAYEVLLQANPQELDALYRDILIGVTQFFRDKEAFECLDDKVLVPLVENATASKKLRIWACGVATGEEVYSLAMLIDERVSASSSGIEVKLFATDVHQGSLERAIKGVYSAEAVNDLPGERRARYFVRKPDGYHVTSELRLMVVFAEHNVLKDAPFAQLDLITCRNMLIYLQPEAQMNALSLFHFGLRSGGYLFLGPSETTISLSDEFETIDSRWRLFRKRRDMRLPVDTVRHFSVSTKIQAQTSLSGQEGRQQYIETLDSSDDGLSRIRALENDLALTQESLQSTIEELESANEELQTANEEMLSSNEELQSANEELQSINGEYQHNILELSLANDDMTNLLAITGVGVLFLDENLRIRRYTPEMARLFSLQQQDLGRAISDFNHSLDYQSLIADVEHTIDSGKQFECNVRDIDGTPYLMRIAPYHRRDGVSGAALMLIDSSAMADVQKEIATYKYMSDQTVIGQILTDQDGRIHFANPALCKVSGKTSAELGQSSVHSLFPLLDRAFVKGFFEPSANRQVKPFESILLLDSGVSVPVELSPNLLEIQDKTLLFIAVQDITERHEAAQQMKLYESAIEATDSGISIADARHPDQPLIYVNEAFRNMTGYTSQEILGKNCRLLQGIDTSPAMVEKLHLAIEAQEPVRTVILNYDQHGQSFWNDLIVNPVSNAEGVVTHFVAVASNVTEQVEDAMTLQAREAQVSTIINATEQAIFGVNTKLQVTFVNSAALELVGLSIDETTSGKRLDVLLNLAPLERDLGEYQNVAQLLDSLVSQGKSVQLDPITLRRADGAMFSAEISANPVLQKTEVTGAVVMIKNVTEQEAQSQLLTRALEQADQASRAKSDFLANMSHEIRTPLTAVMGFTDLMSMSLEDKEQIENASAIKHNALHLLDLVNDILDLSKLESALLKIDSELVSLPALVAGLRSMHQMRADQKDLSFSFKCLSPVPHKIQTDPVRLRQVLVNLISNALKFTMQGSVAVEFESRNSMLIISVRDTGPGIAADQLSEMFLPFRQGSLGASHGGTGLGLSISKHLMELLGGELMVESQLGEGSVFTVRIPLADEADRRLISEFVQVSDDRLLDRDNPPTSLRGHILVAEDNLDVQRVIRQLLSKAGATVTCVSDGVRALEALRQAPDAFDLVLLDIRMPRLGGEEVVRQLQDWGFSKPVVAITAHAMAGDHDRYREIGFVDSLSKPIDTRLLLARLAALMDQDSEPQLAPQLAPQLDVLLVEDHDQSRQVLVKLLTRLGCKVKGAANGAEALMLLRQCKPRLCLLDMGLPDMNGLDVIAAMSKEEENLPVTFVAMTGSISQSDREAYRDAGIEQVLAKPVDIAQIKSLLQTSL
ncbi:chemotaxis protein CheB [Granulosicoccus antarcticus]|uniref:Aerobic respiration control sensor protein ArcB n=1 Tax=Granulosicoccus antarcticus IMCC3135 TaxID=1192854 RepID=A0A2Z2NLX5_9GAMM|nr:chemotaxis protein CheB [Granulosicoccus antarcticus]ASJ72442.1 Aerobic respiration control sensor protein ArcB [Granulosicoccus antarcticus IMCC3135]